MSDKIKLIVEIYERIRETHEVIVSKEEKKEIENIDSFITVFDYISEKTLIEKDWDSTDYDIIEEAEIDVKAN